MVSVKIPIGCFRTTHAPDNELKPGMVYWDSPE